MPPGDYFLPYIPMIEKIIYFQLIKTGYYRFDEKDELAQMVFIILLKREKKILNAFRNEGKFSAFLAVTVTNICRDLKKKKIRENSIFQDLSGEVKEIFSNNLRSRDFSQEQLLVLDEYIEKLKIIFNTYPKNRWKIIITLKAFERITVLFSEVPNTDLDVIKIKIIEECLTAINDFRFNLTDQEIYRLLTRLFNLIQVTNNSNDALRKWINDKMEEIISQLNGNPPNSYFNKETFMLLFEYYCEKQK